MESTKYVGLDVHKEATTIAVMNSASKVIMESIIETKAITIRQFIQGLRGDLHVTFEEGTWAAWLYDLLKPYVTKVVVCDPRRNTLLKVGNKSDRIDPKKLAELLRNGSLSEVYHGENGVRTLKELARSYLTISKDLGRLVQARKSMHRGTVQNGSARSRKLACVVAPSTITNNSTRCRPCAVKCGRIYWSRAGNITQPNCYARSLVSVRFGRLSWSH